MLVADFLPDQSAESLSDSLRDVRGNGRQASGRRLRCRPAAATVGGCIARSRRDSGRSPRWPSLRKPSAATGRSVQACEIRVTGSRGFEKAEVTAGGVALDEVDSRTMESKLVPNLFIAGEILDLDGFIGGYNFQAAFSTGWLAGESV